MHRNTARIVTEGRPVSWLGANFWSRTGGTAFAALASHAAEPLIVTPVLDGGQTGETVTLEPFGTKIFQVTGSGPVF